jgi:hypothetical protein
MSAKKPAIWKTSPTVIGSVALILLTSWSLATMGHRWANSVFWDRFSPPRAEYALVTMGGKTFKVPQYFFSIRGLARDHETERISGRIPSVSSLCPKFDCGQEYFFISLGVRPPDMLGFVARQESMLNRRIIPPKSAGNHWVQYSSRRGSGRYNVDWLYFEGSDPTIHVSCFGRTVDRTSKKGTLYRPVCNIFAEVNAMSLTIRVNFLNLSLFLKLVEHGRATVLRWEQQGIVHQQKTNNRVTIEGQQ